jgi:hypothetical protein
MNRMACRPALFAALLLLIGAAAQAQVRQNYDVTPLNFDLWCQETAHIAPDRCDKRLPEDEETFEAYRAKIDAYEIPYLQQKNKDARIETDIMHNDPTDRPPTRGLETQAQQGTQAPPLPQTVP